MAANNNNRFEQARELRADAQEIEQLLDQLRSGALEELLDIFRQFEARDEIQLLQLILLLRQARRQRSVSQEIEQSLRAVGGGAVGGAGGEVEASTSAEASATATATSASINRVLMGRLRHFDIDAQLVANEGILSEAITPDLDGAALRINIAVDTGTTLSATLERGGDQSGAVTFNSGDNITAGNIFAFDLPSIPDDVAVNWQVGSTVTGNFVAIEEIPANVA